MTYKILIAGILVLSVQSVYAADTASDADSQTEPSAEQAVGKPAQPVKQGAQTPAKVPESTDKKPAAEESEPDCE